MPIVLTATLQQTTMAASSTLAMKQQMQSNYQADWHKATRLHRCSQCGTEIGAGQRYYGSPQRPLAVRCTSCARTRSRRKKLPASESYKP